MHAFPTSLSMMSTSLSAITILGTPAEFFDYGFMYMWMIVRHGKVIQNFSRFEIHTNDFIPSSNLTFRLSALVQKLVKITLQCLMIVANACGLLISAEVFVPIFYRLKVRTTYEYLEMRFNGIVRKTAVSLYLTVSLIFTGLAVYAPATGKCKQNLQTLQKFVSDCKF